MVTIKRTNGTYVASNGLSISKDNDWAGLWSVYTTPHPPLWKTKTLKKFMRYGLAKEFVLDYETGE